ncbi:MAG: transposase [Elusimicrobiota bacterium]
MIKFKKRIRLEDFGYKGVYRYFITVCTNKNVGQCFSIAKKDAINNIIELLKSVSIEFNFIVWVYCFMPDHLHLLIEGCNENSDFKKFISMFKQKSGFYYKRLFQKKLWQINYYEHIFRKEETTKQIVRYILENPIRKGLVKDFYEYPFSGSFMLDVKNL